VPARRGQKAVDDVVNEVVNEAVNEAVDTRSGLD
jgi:hypothetical protein